MTIDMHRLEQQQGIPDTTHRAYFAIAHTLIPAKLELLIACLGNLKLQSNYEMPCSSQISFLDSCKDGRMIASYSSHNYFIVSSCTYVTD